MKHQGSVGDMLWVITLSLSHTQSTSTPFPPLRSIPVTRTGQYYYRLKSNDDDDDDDEVSTLIIP